MAKVKFIIFCLCAFLHGTPAKLTDGQKAVLLQAHNFYRSSVSPSAADMLSMRWNDTLSGLAQQTAEKCDFNTGFTTSHYMGENTLSTPASITSSYADLVETQWFAEYQSYDYASGSCSRVCSHYTQLVQSSFDQLGCGSAVCNPVRRLSGALIYNALFLVCRYGFAAVNTKGQPYLSGPFCSGCPSNKPICSNRLCDAAVAAISNSTQLPRPTATTAHAPSVTITPSTPLTRLTSTDVAKLSRPATTSPSATGTCSARSCSTLKATPTSTTLIKVFPQADVQILAKPTSTMGKFTSSTAKPLTTLTIHRPTLTSTMGKFTSSTAKPIHLPTPTSTMGKFTAKPLTTLTIHRPTLTSTMGKFTAKPLTTLTIHRPTLTSTMGKFTSSTAKPLTTLSTPTTTMGKSTTLKPEATPTAVLSVTKITKAAKQLLPQAQADVPGVLVTPTPTTGKYSTPALKATLIPKAGAGIFPRTVVPQPPGPMKVHHSSRPNPLNDSPPLLVNPPPGSPITLSPQLKKSLKTIHLRTTLDKRYKTHESLKRL